MKKLLLLVLGILILSASLSFAAGTVTTTLVRPNEGSRVLIFTCTADVSGSIPVTTTNVSMTNELQGWWAYYVVTNPGTSMTADYDITLTDADGIDIMGGKLADRSATVSQSVVPYIDSTNGIYGGRAMNGTLTLTITNNTANTSTVVVKVFFAR
jgi:hypothetical protein